MLLLTQFYLLAMSINLIYPKWCDHLDALCEVNLSDIKICDLEITRPAEESIMLKVIWRALLKLYIQDITVIAHLD